MGATAERFQVQHQPGIDIRFYDPGFRHWQNIDAPEHGDRIDAVFYEILTSPVGRRALGINQLSKSETEETYEGSTDFKRWQHVAGTYKIVRYFADKTNPPLTEDQIVQYALVACIPDLGHGVKSHVTDMLKEGMGGKEDFHEQRTGQIIDFGGLKQILAKHGITSPFDENGNIAIEVPPWVDGPSPGLSVDRLHYINAEISLMFPNNELVTEAIKLENMVITEDGELAFRDIQHARVWAKAANLCSSEHWNDPANRLIELFSLEAMKRTISKRYLEGVNNFDNGYVGAPEDYTYLIDQDFDEALEREALSQRPDLFMNTVYSLVQSISHHERQRFARHRKVAYEEYLEDDDAREYPNALINPHKAVFGILPPQVEILRSQKRADEQVCDVAVLKLADNGEVVGGLKALKFRQFDPLVVTNKGPQKLSELDKNFAETLRQNNEAISYVGEVTLHTNPESRVALTAGVKENWEYMEKAKNYHALSPDQIRRIIKSSGDRALDLAMASGAWVEL